MTFQLDETQARALDAMVGYGADSFFEAFYTLGKHYMQPDEGGLRSLFKEVGEQVTPQLARIDRLRRTMDASDKEVSDKNLKAAQTRGEG